MSSNGVICNRRVSIGGIRTSSRRTMSHRLINSIAHGNNRIIRFKIPRTEERLQYQTPVSDRSSTWEQVKTLLPHDKVSVEPANDQEAHVLKVFGLQPDKNLHVPPLSHLPSPFAYHSHVNGDRSYISQPRLSVSKLLTNAWCELRTFYEVYAGLPRLPPLASMKLGTKYHEKLEAAEHPKRKVILLKAQIKSYLSEHLHESIKELTKTKVAYEFAQNWIEQTVFRSICAGHTGVARELFLHGFLDLALGSLVNQEEKLKEGVLVNGIADIVQIDHFNATEAFDEADIPGFADEDSTQNLPTNIPIFDLTEVLDLSVELKRTKAQMKALAVDHFLHIRDVKTRRLNFIPNQELVIEGAKLQCMYYAVFLHNLSRDAEFAYASCLENLRRRRVDPDQPVSVALATELLVVNFRTLVLDFLRLAQGVDIGFSRFDNHKQPATDYSFSQFINEEQFKNLIKIHYGDDLDVSGFDLSPLFKNWKVPLTLRYISARTGQAFNTYEAFDPSSVCVEYHNPQKQKILARLHYPFDRHAMEGAVTATSNFWNGQARPSHTDDPTMCAACTFKKRCSAINSEVGLDVANLIKELQES